MDSYLASRLQRAMPFLDFLVAAAEETGLATRRFVYAHRRRRYLTLRPGTDTPLWDELVRTLVAHLRRRGDKAALARFLGIPRQRLHVLLVSRTRCPDAERTLLMLVWLAQQTNAPSRRRLPRSPQAHLSSNR